MNEISTVYEEYKQEVKEALVKTSEDFVYLGYLFRKAKEDNSILEGSGYSNYKDFAMKEFQIDESTLSRFININIKYGSGPNLLPQYKEYGRAKLQDMLSLPDTIVEEIPPELPRTEVQEIVKEHKEEQKITPIEASIEELEYDDDLTFTQNFFIAYFKEDKEDFLHLYDIFEDEGEAKAKFIKYFAPAGSAVLKAKIPGKGRYMLTIKDNAQPTYTSLRTEEKSSEPWECILDDIYNINWAFSKAGWEEFYEEPFEPDIEEEEATEEKSTKTNIEEAMNPPENEPKKEEEPQKTVEETPESLITSTTEPVSEEAEKVEGEVIDPNKYNNLINAATTLRKEIIRATEEQTQFAWIDVKVIAERIADFAKKEERRLAPQ